MKETYELIAALERLRDNNDRARLASLKRGLGQPPGAVLESSRVVEHMLDEDDPPWIADTLYVVAPLFALHPISAKRTRRNDMGSHFRALFDQDQDPRPNVERRFLALLSSEPDDLPDALRQAVSLLKSKEIAVNWHQLFDDVQKWMDRRPEGEKKRQEVRVRWSRHFWRLSSPKPGSGSNQTEAELA